MTLLDLCHFLHLESDLLESFFTRCFRHMLVHIGPLIILSCRCVFQVGRRIRHRVTMKRLEPQLGMFLLVARRFFEDARDLFHAFFSCLLRIIRVLVACLAFTGKCRHQILFSL